ncbi:hypothetical protein TWF217_000087 [Orbilia oligospora]|nr:hypothetical protein TWF751_002995 [Orbilia oligospora]KAF3272601.1 hypothetical protein TWF217_000087 [Orbilia oligospora]
MEDCWSSISPSQKLSQRTCVCGIVADAAGTKKTLARRTKAGPGARSQGPERHHHCTTIELKDGGNPGAE